jgi:hypothetical protein
MRSLRAAALLSFVALSGCFGMCGPSLPSPEASCIDDPAPAGGAALELGASFDGDFAPLRDDASLSLDYGDQGGQHFYYAIRAFGMNADAIVLVRFFRDGVDDPDGGAGGAGSATSGGGEGGAGTGGVATGGGGGAGGEIGSTTSSSSSGGPDGEGGYGASFQPSEVIFLSDHFDSGDCEGEWFEVLGLYVQVPAAERTSGLLRAQIGTCPTNGCPFDASGEYVLEEVLATDEVRITYVP